MDTNGMIPWADLDARTEGELVCSNIMRVAYATDASAYRERPLGVFFPRSTADLKEVVAFAGQHGVPLIARAGGTSLAGQVVGNGLVVDVSRYMTSILELNVAERWVRVQPGVIPDCLNAFLKPHGLFFGPETSTSNRCTLGGMVGNNSCGAHSLIYGSTRDHLISVKMLLHDGGEVTLGDLKALSFALKRGHKSLIDKIYSELYTLLSIPENQHNIRAHFPHPDIKRRNHGYALDALLETDPFTQNGVPFNLAKLIAGSEGTLGIITEIKLNLVPSPPPFKALLCVHLHSVEEALRANLVALEHRPAAIELMDEVILECTRGNLSQQRNRFFVEGSPGAILIIECAGADEASVRPLTEGIVKALRAAGLGYSFPVITGADMNKVWALRKAGLGVLSNLKGDAKPVSVVEDTALRPCDLPEFIVEFRELLAKHGLKAVYHAHIATGELHLRPVLDLKKSQERALFRLIARETALLVRKYRGSLSGEHGDGRLRGEFIPLMYGPEVYAMFLKVKELFDPQNIFNPGKITASPPMNTSLRYEENQETRSWDTCFDFSDTLGLMRAVEACNGSGDCRKPASMGGVMCPTYMATGNELFSTRARANVMRETLTHSSAKNPFDYRDLWVIMDGCISCKGCMSECPSNVDLARLKAEFLYQYYRSNGVPIRSLAIAYNSYIQRIGSIYPKLYNRLIKSKWIASLAGFSREVELPSIARRSFRRAWSHQRLNQLNQSIESPKGEVFIYLDEFSRFNDVWVAEATVQLLHRLGYRVLVPEGSESGRAAISKGLLRRAARMANRNIQIFHPLVSPDRPLVGIEPSCILSFRDEYPRLCAPELREKARELAAGVLTLEEFVAREFKRGHIVRESFTSEPAQVLFHGHCHQKALTTTSFLKTMLSIPLNYSVNEIPSGCCGMAGSFGYEKEHHELAQKIGELVLFPAVREAEISTILVAPGTSCRHHIELGTGRHALHPAEVLYRALI